MLMFLNSQFSKLRNIFLFGPITQRFQFNIYGTAAAIVIAVSHFIHRELFGL